MASRWTHFKVAALREGPLLLLQFAWLVYSRLFQKPILIDDAYIHFRNALNWAQGKGLIFNAGERVLATTSPVYALILGALHRLSGIDLPRLAEGFNFACEVAIVLCLLHLLRRAGAPLLIRHAVVAITSLETWRMVYCHGGMEMSFFIAVILLIAICIHHALHAPLREYQSAFHIPHSALIAAGLLLGILGWIRPEGSVVWIAAALALAFGRRWRELFWTYGLAGSVACAVCALLLYKYGGFLPQSVTAKAHAPWFNGNNGWPPAQFAITLGDLTPFGLFNGFRSAWATTGDKINSLILMSAQIALMGFGMAALWRRGERFLSLFLGLFVAGYYSFHALLATCIFDWYFVPYYFGAQTLAGLGWWLAIQYGQRRIDEWRPGRPAWGRAFYGLATLALVGLYAVAGAWMGEVSRRIEGLTFGDCLRYRLVGSEDFARERQYIDFAKAFNALIPQGDPAPVGCIEIGIFGYYFHGRVFDAFGLVSPEALDALKPASRKALPPSCQEFPYNVLMHFKPKYIMSAMIFLRDQPKEFFDAYEELKLPGLEDAGSILCYRLKEKGSAAAEPAKPSQTLISAR